MHSVKDRHEVDWDAVKQVDIVTIGDDGDVDIVVTMKFQQKFKVFDRIFSIPKFGKMARSHFLNKFLFKLCPKRSHVFYQCHNSYPIPHS